MCPDGIIISNDICNAKRMKFPALCSLTEDVMIKKNKSNLQGNDVSGLNAKRMNFHALLYVICNCSFK